MNTSVEDRKLAAIVSIDLVGYSSMMRGDEEGTLASLQEARETVIDPLVEACNGRIFKSLGDGMLMEFGAISDAVQCALDIQSNIAEWNRTGHDGPALGFRIGINLADVIPDEDDLYGDGVNVAARLEALAEPSGICITGIVYDQIKTRFPGQFKRVGRKKLKNIDDPIEVYSTTGGASGLAWGRNPFLFEDSRRKWLLSGVAGLVLLTLGAAAWVMIDHERAMTPASIENEVRKAKAAAAAVKEKARAEAEAANAEAQAAAQKVEAAARLEVIQKTVDVWKKASLELTEATEALREAETALAEAKAARKAAEVGDADSAKDVTKAGRELDAARESHKSAIAGEKLARKRMDEVKAGN